MYVLPRAGNPTMTMTNLSPFVPDSVGLGACAIWGWGFSWVVAWGAIMTLDVERAMEDLWGEGCAEDEEEEEEEEEEEL